MWLGEDKISFAEYLLTFVDGKAKIDIEIGADIVQIPKNFFGEYIWFLNQKGVS